MVQAPAVSVLTRFDFEEALNTLSPDTPLSIALTDIDNFGSINDDYGRAAGDAVIAKLETTLVGSLPRGSIIGRIGGDEYAVALPDTPAESALIMLEEIRLHFGKLDLSPEVPRRVHLSVGIAARPPHATNIADLMRAADEALYRAKTEGRGRVALYVESKMTLKSNYYSKASLERLSKLSAALNRTEASLLREALDDLLGKYSETL